jgi:hypothetical protein
MSEKAGRGEPISISFTRLIERLLKYAYGTPPGYVKIVDEETLL